MKSQRDELAEQGESTRRRSQGSNEPTSARTSETEKFCKVVEDVLGKWNFPDHGRITFSEDYQDIVINGQDRRSHGKGIRALSYAAFVVSLLQYARLKDYPHSGFVVLDSPLVAYREPDSSAEVQKLGVKEAFFRFLSGMQENRQIIVFENEDPPEEFHSSIKFVHFSKTRETDSRYGFYPSGEKNT